MLRFVVPSSNFISIFYRLGLFNAPMKRISPFWLDCIRVGWGASPLKTSMKKRLASQRARAVPSQILKPIEALPSIFLSFLMVNSTFWPLYGVLSLSMK